MLRTLLVSLALLLALAGTAAAEVSPFLSFSARLASTDGTPISGMRRLRFTLYGADAGGAALWTQESDVVVNAGFAYQPLGTPPFPAGLFHDPSLFLEIAVIGGTVTETFTPRLALTSVPYAIHASSALTADEAVHALSADHALTAGDADTLGGREPASFQAATTAACPAGSYVSAITPAGAATCSPIDPNVVQRRVGAECPLGQSIRRIGVNGEVTCEVDTDTDTDTDTAFASCSWSRASTGLGTSPAISAVCGAQRYAVSGGCYGGNSSAITVRRSSPAGVLNGSGISAATSWYCEFNTANGDNTAFALCCANY